MKTEGERNRQDAQARSRRDRNQAAIRLLDEWLADESGYDEETWEGLKKTVEENRLSYRKRFSD